MAHRRQVKDMKKLIDKDKCVCCSCFYEDDFHLSFLEEEDVDVESGGACFSCDKEFNSVESWLVHMNKEHWRI